MENRNLQNFISEAETYLPMIRNGILVCSREGNAVGELETALCYAQAIKDAAGSVALGDIADSAARLEVLIRGISAVREPLSDAQTRTLLDHLAQTEALMAKLQFSADDFTFNLDGFVEESFLNLGFDAPVISNEMPTTAAEPEEAFEEFEIDEEMLEIFAEEAEDLLRNINSHLKILQSNPADREALLEIRRNAHTLKGSAGIVGLKPLSNLAHRVEDLLDHLSEKNIEGNRKIFELLQTSTDCLSALAINENTAQNTKRLEILHKDYDEILASLENGTFIAGETAAEEIFEIPAETGFEIVSEQPKSEIQATGANPKSVVRVSLEKLDELVRMVGDLVISRSVFEQRLAELERQIGELQHGTHRLLRATGKLETDFEASLMPAPSSGFRVPGYNSSFIAHHSSSNFDALEFDHYTEFHQTTRELTETARDSSAINTELDKLHGDFETLFGTQSRLIEEMHDKLLHLRMVRFGSLTPRLQRTVRVTCEQDQKQADLTIEGEATEIDSQILDLLVEPLLHLLRNAVAHGIETPDTRRLLGKPERAKIMLRMHSEGTHIIMTVSDDGRGISAAALREKAVRNNFITPEEASKMSEEEAFALCFLPGLTTAGEVSQTAGRGVGMNIIRTNVLRGQGTISISSEPQKGATFMIRMPMALAITRGLLVKTGGQLYAFPLKLVRKISEISSEAFINLPEKGLARLDETDHKIAYLGTLLNSPPLDLNKEIIPLIILETLDTPRALMVDEIVRAEELVIKPLAAPLQNYPNLLGATILGDGCVVPVLDLISLFQNQIQSSKLKNQFDKTGEPQYVEPPPLKPEPKILKIMIVDDSPSVRHITSKLIKNAGWETILAKDGLEALEALQSGEALPDAVLTDVEMPRMDGYELLSSIRNQPALQKLPVIMITSRASEKHHQKAVELGVSDYVTKPFDDVVLIERIKFLTKN